MNYSFLNKINRTIKGFTLVEMLVVLGLFSFIMTLATSVLYSTQAVNVKIQETQAVLDNVNVSMDIMARDIRYGTDFHCGPTVSTDPIEGEASSYTLRRSCTYGDGGGKFIFFKPIDASDLDRVAYYASTTIDGNEVIFKNEYIGATVNRYQITANDVKIKSLIFYIEGANTATGVNADVLNAGGFEIHDQVQPLVTITLSGETIPIKQNSSSTSFIIQSSISSRTIDK